MSAQMAAVGAVFAMGGGVNEINSANVAAMNALTEKSTKL